MSEYILNLLPLRAEERADFEVIAADDTQIFAHRNHLTEEMLEQATAIIGWPNPSDVPLAKNLRWLHSMWAGLDEYVGVITFPEGCRITSSVGTNAQSVSEHMLALLLSVCHRIPEARDAQMRQQWNREAIGTYKTMDGATVLVLGAGNIGRRFGKLCQSIGAYTIGLQRTPSEGLEGFHQVQTMDKLDELLPTADVVALCLPHSPSTNLLMNAQRFSYMREGSILLNAGRGTAVDNDALVAALESGKLWAAALDVTEPEPLPEDHPLWKAPNLLITPHCAAGLRLDITRANILSLAQENLRRYLDGQPLLNEAKEL